MDYSVTIMIPAFNQPKYIAQAVASALDQDYDNLEVIVADDSTDTETETALLPYITNKKLTYFKNDRRLGRVENYRQLLNRLARGSWVIMLDGDDYFLDRRYVSRAIQFIREDSSIVLVGAGIRVLNEATQRSESFGLTDHTVVFDGKEVFSKYNRLPNHQTDLYRRDLAQKLDFYRHPSTGSDSESLFRLCLHGKVAYLAEDVAVWRIHSSNTTFVHDINKQIKELSFIDSVYSYSLQFLDKETAGKWRTNMYRSMVMHLLSISGSAKKHLASIRIIVQYGKFIGLKLSAVYLLRTVGFYKQPSTSITN